MSWGRGRGGYNVSGGRSGMRLLRKPTSGSGSVSLSPTPVAGGGSRKEEIRSHYYSPRPSCADNGARGHYFSGPDAAGDTQDGVARTKGSHYFAVQPPTDAPPLLAKVSSSSSSGCGSAHYFSSPSAPNTEGLPHKASSGHYFASQSDHDDDIDSFDLPESQRCTLGGSRPSRQRYEENLSRSDSSIGRWHRGSWSNRRLSDGGRGARGKAGGRGYQANSFVQGVAAGGPEYWSLTVKQLWDLWLEIKDGMLAYCRDHARHQFRHVCKRPECSHDHMGETFIRMDELGEEAQKELVDLKPNMHLVVRRYIKPRTLDHHRSFARMVNEGDERMVDIFISHCWNENFGDFVSTLHDALDEDDAVWVCSFALDQNSDITAELGADVLKSPFAVALREASEVIMVIDANVEPLTRSWCVYEMYLATLLGKKLDIWTHNWSPHLFKEVADKVANLDVRSCSASNPDDHKRIMDAIAGKEDEVNKAVRRNVARAMKKVGAMHRDTAGGG